MSSGKKLNISYMNTFAPPFPYMQSTYMCSYEARYHTYIQSRFKLHWKGPRMVSGFRPAVYRLSLGRIATVLQAKNTVPGPFSRVCQQVSYTREKTHLCTLRYKIYHSAFIPRYTVPLGCMLISLSYRCHFFLLMRSCFPIVGHIHAPVYVMTTLQERNWIRQQKIMMHSNIEQDEKTGECKCVYTLSLPVVSRGEVVFGGPRERVKPVVVRMN